MEDLYEMKCMQVRKSCNCQLCTYTYLRIYSKYASVVHQVNSDALMWRWTVAKTRQFCQTVEEVCKLWHTKHCGRKNREGIDIVVCNESEFIWLSICSDKLTLFLLAWTANDARPPFLICRSLQTPSTVRHKSIWI